MDKANLISPSDLIKLRGALYCELAGLSIELVQEGGKLAHFVLSRRCHDAAEVVA